MRVGFLQMRPRFGEVERNVGHVETSLRRVRNATIVLPELFTTGYVFASRTEARQIVRHNGILVNGKRVNIPSYQVRAGDVVEVTEKAKAQLRIKAACEAAEGRGFPDWIEVDVKALKGTYKSVPQRSDLPATINESMVVELYSK